MERQSQTKSARLAQVSAILLALFCTSPLFAQHISIRLKDSSRALVHIDSADWSDAWIELNGQWPNAKPLTKDSFIISESGERAEILSIDSIGARYQSDLTLSFVLDNSGSMFHAYDSLTRICDTLV